MKLLRSAARLIGGAALTLLSASVGAQLPDAGPVTLYVNGRIHTGDSAGTVSAMAVAHERIVAVGSAEEVGRAGRVTRRVDLRGATVIPGIIDSHAHTFFGSMALHGLNLSTPQGSINPGQPEAFVAALRQFAAAHSSDRILFARADFDINKPPSNAMLDRAVADRPLIVHNVAEHAIWVNSKALALAGIDKSPNPNPAIEAGIMRNADGSPNGLVREGSMIIVERPVIAALTMPEKLSLLKQGIAFLNSFGITTVVNATGDLDEIRLYDALHRRGELNVRTRTAFGAVAVPHHLTPEFLADLETARTSYNDDWVSSNLVKFFMDGATTGWPMIYSPTEFKTLVGELDRRGYQVMTHALSPAATRTALDGYEAVEKESGRKDHRFRIEHADFLLDGDLKRFEELSVVASMQPSFCCDTWKPGDFVTEQWHSLIASGATLAFSSDWPCTFPPDPFRGMQELVTREAWTGIAYGAAQSGRTPTGQVNAPAERLTIEQAVEGYTKGGAYANFMENRLGSLAVGKLADFVVLNQDMFTVPADRISQTKPTATIVGGRVVFGTVD